MILSLRKLPEGTHLSQPFTLLATWFGSGLIKPASGTWGSLASLPFILALFMVPYPYSALSLLSFIALTFFIGLWAAHRYMAISKNHDASEIVIDETCGLAISFLCLLSMGSTYKTSEGLLYTVLIFGLFRFFDAVKPYPINYLDKNIDGAIGVMIDDIAAGIAASLTFIGGKILWEHLV